MAEVQIELGAECLRVINNVDLELDPGEPSIALVSANTVLTVYVTRAEIAAIKRWLKTL